MDALGVRSQLRFSAVFEWAVAAAFLFATLVVVSLIVRELRVEPPPPVTGATHVLASIPPAVPARAVSVPVLPLKDGVELRIGQTIAAVASRLGRAAESGRQELDRGTHGERLTRFYEYAGTRFVLVFEPFELNGEAKLAGIFLC